ncbi:proprotein convertase P-domain-containing protein [Nocardioides stalactiti]|uniref:proprotein convertase P-domain-containing protein n=1 Tax=Nocardioides stalactiti TaxID=2755356 RepID=UPI001604727A|nr:proprotein convertase P-domain-containing protein [Nocardioides stalactiti]
MKRLLPPCAALLVACASVVLPVVGPPTASAAVSCVFNRHEYPSASIPDQGTATTTIDLAPLIPAGEKVVDLDVGVRIDHGFIGDLAISLEYAGEKVDLSSGNGGSEHSYGGTAPALFDDAAAEPITSATPPYLGTYRPEESLDAFDDLNPRGVWTLRVADQAAGDSGAVYTFALFVTTDYCEDTDKDGLKDPYDQCPTVKGPVPGGCPARNRVVTLGYNATVKEFRGKLSSSTETRCAAGQPVRIYRALSGADQLISRTRTDGTGVYKVPRVNPLGTYYAVAPKNYLEGVATCSRAQSANLVR